ncbi:unnamed protein product [Rhizoctonia solani]|uniref:Uncharacterized protein n=1 Tax=Rhizoctonia solani TaxID=456999 RepID=A0A8H3BDN0_9AGAM|nr:unnamed protein product [Rhizoctonia solani]
MPHPRKLDGPETVPKKPAPGRRNRRWPKQERALPDRNSQDWGVTNREPGKVWGEGDNAWAETGPTGWGTEGWGQAEATDWGVQLNHDDWALEAYTTTKIEAWRKQVEACPRHELVRTPSATSEEPAVIDHSPLEPVSPSHPITSKLYRWALNFLNREKVSADRKRLALSFLKQSRQQQLECIRRLIEEIRQL